MQRRRSGKKVAAALLSALLLNASWAALGAGPANFGSHAVTSQRQAESAGASPYTDVETTLDSGTVVHEYLDSAGSVFAVSWAGPVPPDLKQLLGQYFDTMAARGRTGPGGTGGNSASDPVIVSGGHMGALSGQAWLPDKLPPGFSPGDMQ